MRIFVRISRKKLVVERMDVESDKPIRSYPANKSGAAKLGRFIARHGIHSASYSSSVDHPEDGGAPDLDFRSLIEAGYQAAMKRKANRTKSEFLAYYYKSGPMTRAALIEQLLQRVDVDGVQEALSVVKKGKETPGQLGGKRRRE